MGEPYGWMPAPGPIHHRTRIEITVRMGGKTYEQIVELLPGDDAAYRAAVERIAEELQALVSRVSEATSQ